MACTDLIDKATFLVLYPSFSDPTYDAVIDLKIGCLPCALCADAWGCDLQNGSANYLAHEMIMHLKTLNTGLGGGTGGGGVGQVTAQTMGPVTRSYGTSSSDGDGSLSETAPGREYLRLAGGRPVTGIAPGMDLGDCY